MKNYHLHIPEGVRDFMGETAEHKQQITQRILMLFSKYSYHLIETPTFEYVDVFNRAQEVTQSPQRYQFVNKQGELVALRSDMTCAIARVAVTQNQEVAYPQRYCYLANSFRYPERYQGKSHEFTQAGVELIGNDSIEGDAEVLRLAIEAVQAAGIDDFVIHLGNGAFFSSLLEELRISPDISEEIYGAIETKDAVAIKSILAAECIDEGQIEIISQFIQRTGDLSLLMQIGERVEGTRTKAALAYLASLYGVLRDYGVIDRIQFDLSILSYANYYTGMMFKLFVPEIGMAICEGGRYNTLLEKYGRDLPAVGFGMNVDLLLQKIRQQQYPTGMNKQSTLIVYHPETRGLALELAAHFRKQGMIIENYFDQDIAEAIAYAQSVGMGGILYFQSKETVAIYDMTDQEMHYMDPMALF
ncbi:MAG: ATP phosphoribosyltransferase regulatory subunit [Cellulosilyticaceae bacterium]